MWPELAPAAKGGQDVGARYPFPQYCAWGKTLSKSSNWPFHFIERNKKYHLSNPLQEEVPFAVRLHASSERKVPKTQERDPSPFALCLRTPLISFPPSSLAIGDKVSVAPVARIVPTLDRAGSRVDGG